VLASECSAESVSLNKFEYPRQSVIVIGSEGTGVSRLLLEESDFKVNIPMYGKIDSLNVAQATAIFAYEYSRQLEATNFLKK
jgi:23S rRNA (guanosine2251-2'-O)-methyltransferase